MRPQSLDIDASRLLPRYRSGAALRQEQLAVLRREAAAVHVDDRTVTIPERCAKAEPGDLRGIPALARGVGGVIPGTSPEHEVLRRMSLDRFAA